MNHSLLLFVIIYFFFSLLTCANFRKSLKTFSKCKEKRGGSDNPTTLLESTTGNILTCSWPSVSMAHCTISLYIRDLSIWTLVSMAGGMGLVDGWWDGGVEPGTNPAQVPRDVCISRWFYIWRNGWGNIVYIVSHPIFFSLKFIS